MLWEEANYSNPTLPFLFFRKVYNNYSLFYFMEKKEDSYYYKNRDKKIAYQKKYDKKNKDKKRAYDVKRRKLKDYNKKKYFQHYSQKHHFPILIKKYNGCQFCKSNKKLEIHHKKYTKNIKDCVLLCQKCHKKLHSLGLLSN